MFSIQPYCEVGGVRLYHADVLAHLDEFRPSFSVLTVTDPPFNSGQIFAGEVDRRFDYQHWSASWFAGVSRFSRATVFTPGFANLAMWQRLEEPAGMFPLLYPNRLTWEPVLVYGTVEALEVCHRFAACRFSEDEGRWNGWHPCPKPEEFYRDASRRFGQPGDSLFEPFAGSGTALRFALRHGLDCIAFEEKEDYCERIALDLSTLEEELHVHNQH
jgi:DNA modification methylase